MTLDEFKEECRTIKFFKKDELIRDKEGHCPICAVYKKNFPDDYKRRLNYPNNGIVNSEAPYLGNEYLKLKERWAIIDGADHTITNLKNYIKYSSKTNRDVHVQSLEIRKFFETIL